MKLKRPGIKRRGCGRKKLKSGKKWGGVGGRSNLRSGSRGQTTFNRQNDRHGGVRQSEWKEKSYFVRGDKETGNQNHVFVPKGGRSGKE